MVESNSLKKVLALFDEEDLKYVDLSKIGIHEKDNSACIVQKVKKIGEKNDGFRK